MIAERLTAQMLGGTPASDPVSVVRRLLAVQGQDPKGARLAIRARSSGLTAADVDNALTEERSLLITTLNRGTLHLVCSEDYPRLQALTTPQLLTSNATRLGQEGVSAAQADRAVAIVARAIERDGPQVRAQLRYRIEAAGIPLKGQALPHIVMLASLRGLIVRGPVLDGEHAFVLAADWLGPLPKVDRDRALAELARRFLRGHGPAGDRDLAKWAGLPLRDVRAGLSAIASELHQRDDGLVDLVDRDPAAELPPPRLLGPFDPLLHGWVSREPILGDNVGVVTKNGVFKAIALVDGRAVATWRMPQGEAVLEPFDQIGGKVGAALRDEAADVKRFLGT